jgi:hypothetical protein
MLALIQKQSNPPRASQIKAKLRWHVLLGDLSLFMSLAVARFIIWRTLRRRRKARAARRKRLKLIQGNAHQANQSIIAS